MRWKPLVVLAAMLAPGAAGAQTWRTYSYPEAGFSVHFPAAPVLAKGTYKASDGTSVPAAIYSARQDGVDYTITIADFSHRGLEKDAAIEDAVKVAVGTGLVRADVEARINRQYGRELSVKGQDGDFTVLAIFFIKDHLYRLAGQAGAPDGEQRAPRAVHFQQSLEFLE